MYLNFAAYPIIFQQIRGWNTGVGGLAFLGTLLGTVCAVLVSVLYINPRYVKVAKAKGGRAEPEDRLPSAIWGSALIVIGLAGFAATDGPDVHWIAPIIFGIPFGTGMVVMFLAVLSYLIDSYTIYAASVLAANSVLRSLFGAAFPLFASQMYDTLGIHWAAALPGFIALACIPFIVIFYKYGKRIRAKCKYSADAERQLNAIMAARAATSAKHDEESQVDNATNANANANDKANAPVDPDATPASVPHTAEKQPAEVNEKTRLHLASAPDHPNHHDWTMYEALAERDEVDLDDDERLRLGELHEKFDYAKRVEA